MGVGGGNIGTRRGLLLWKSQLIKMVIHLKSIEIDEIMHGIVSHESGKFSDF